MEIIIIVLIAVEAALAIIREYHDVAELVRSLFTSTEISDVETVGEVTENEHAFFGKVVDAAGGGQPTRADEVEGTMMDGKRLV